jgi:hypothetical protein
MKLILNLSSSELDNEDLQTLTRELCDSIADETEIKADIPTGAVQQGHKGDPITIGVIALAFLTKGAGVAMFEMFKAYFSREPSLVIKIVKPDGTTFEFSAKNMTPEQMQAFLSQLSR